VQVEHQPPRTGERDHSNRCGLQRVQITGKQRLLGNRHAVLYYTHSAVTIDPSQCSVREVGMAGQFNLAQTHANNANFNASW
jgi:hypothetical protein